MSTIEPKKAARIIMNLNTALLAAALLFAAHAYDAQLVKSGKPSAPAFRAALKDALEHSGGIVATQGFFHYSPTDHFGLDANSRMMLTISMGDWRVVTP